jgi:prophage regulatory protein
MGERIIRKPELFNKVGLSDASVWRAEKEGKFPKRLILGGNSCGWLESEIDAWLADKAENRINSTCRKPGKTNSK